jgi:hypothetical protein
MDLLSRVAEDERGVDVDPLVSRLGYVATSL